MVYPAPPFVVLWQFWFLTFLLSQVGQSDLLYVTASVGEFFVIRDFWDTPPCSATIFGFTSPLFCCFISSAISFHEAARVPLGVAGQKTVNSYDLFPPVLHQHAALFSFSLLLSSLFHAVSIFVKGSLSCLALVLSSFPMFQGRLANTLSQSSIASRQLHPFWSRGALGWYSLIFSPPSGLSTLL